MHTRYHYLEIPVINMNPRAFRVVLVLWPILDTLIIRGTGSGMNEGHICTMQSRNVKLSVDSI